MYQFEVDRNRPILAENETSNEPPHLVMQRLQFYKLSPGLAISPSGLTVQVYESKESKDAFYATLNVGIQSGVMTWQYYCPIKCSSIKFGVIKEGYDITKVKDFRLIHLTTSTPRTVTLTLDMTKNLLSLSLDGHPKPKKSITVSEGMWFPLLEIHEQGMLISVDPTFGGISLEAPPRIPTGGFPQAQKVREDLNAIPQIRNVQKNEVLLVKNVVKLLTVNRDNVIEPYHYVNALQSQISSPDQIVSIFIDAKAFEEIKNVEEISLNQEAWNDFKSKTKITNFGSKTFLEGPYNTLKTTIQALLGDQNDERLKYELFVAEEQLYQQGASTFDESSRLGTVFGRMNFLIDQVQTNDQLLLAQNGLIQGPGTKDLKHYQNLRSRLAPPTADADDEQLQSLLPDQQDFFSVPFDVSVNSRPAYRLNEPEAHFELTSCDEYALVYDRKSGSAHLFNAGCALLPQGKINVRKLLTQSQQESQQRFCTTGKPKEEATIHVEEMGITDLFETSQVQEPKSEEIKPDQNLLDQLYNMGFKLDIAKQALIDCENAGLDQALEIVLQLQEKELSNQPEETKKELKLQWICESCTFLNNDQSASCNMCSADAPESAYVEEVKQPPPPPPPPSEPVKQEEQQPSSASAQAQTQPSEVSVEQHNIDFLLDHNKSEVQSVSIGRGLLPLCPLSVVTTFNGVLKSSDPWAKNTVLVTQLALPHNEYHRFYHHKKDEQQFYILNTLRNRVVPATDLVQTLDQEFLQDEQCRKIVLTYTPLFGSQVNEPRNYEVYSQTEIKFDAPIQTALIHEKQLVVILDDKVCFYELKQEQHLDLDPRTSFQLIRELSWDIQGKLKDIKFFKGDLYVSTNNAVLKLTENQGQLSKEQIFDFGAERFSVFEGLIQIHTKDGVHRELSQKKVQGLIQQQQQEDDQIDISKLSSQEIKSLSTLTTQESIYFQGQSYKSLIKHRTDSAYQKHLFYDGVGQLTLHQPSQISQLQIEYDTQEDIAVTMQNQLLGCSLQSESTYLALQVFDYEGASFNNQTHITKSLFPQDDNFTSNYGGAYYIYQHLHSKRMLIQSVTVTSMLRVTQKGNPLGSGLIFLSDNPSYFVRKYWGEFTKKQYQEYRNNKILANEPFTEADPVGYFSLEDTESGNFELDIMRPAKYIMMMPTGFRPKITYTDFFTDAVEFKFFGVQGHTIEDDTEAQLTKWSPINKKLDLVVECDGRQLDVQNQYQVYYQQSAKRLRMVLQHKELQNSVVNNIRVSIPNVKSFVISGTRPTQVQQSIIEKIPLANHLRGMMTNIDNYDKLNQKLVQMTLSENASFSFRISCIELLVSLMNSNMALVHKVFQDLDLKQFILLNLQLTKQEPIVQRFFQNFWQIPEFLTQMQTAILDITSQIYELPYAMTPQGLQFLGNLIFWLSRMRTAEVIPLLFEHLKTAAKKITALKQSQPLYDRLSKNRHTHAELDFQYFSDQYANLQRPLNPVELGSSDPLMNEINQATASIQNSSKPTKSNQSVSDQVIRVQPKTNLPSRILYTSKKFYQHFEIDLYALYKLEYCSFFVNPASLQPKIPKMRIQIYQNEKLVFDQMYAEWFTYQLNTMAERFKDDKRFNQQNLNELRIPIKGITARYVTVQITFSFSALYSTLLEQSQIPTQMMLVPEFSGELLNEDGFQDQKNDIFEKQQNYTKAASIKIGESQNYVSVNCPNGLLLDSSGVYEQSLSVEAKNLKVVLEGEQKTTQEDDNESKNKVYHKYIESLQRQLSDKVLADQGNTDVTTILTQLRRVHLELLKSSRMNQKHFGQSLDFLLTLSHKFMQIILDVDELHKSWRGQPQLSGAYGLSLSECVFQVYVLQESGPVREEALKLLEKVLLDNLGERQWVKFAFTLYDQMGGQYDDLISTYLSTLTFPLPETLLYTAAQLRLIPGAKVELSAESVETLIVQLVRGYNQVPHISFNPKSNTHSSFKRGIAREVHDLFAKPQLQPPKVGRSTSSHEAADFLNEPITQERVLLTTFKVASCLAQRGKFDRTAELFLAVFRKADLVVVKNFLTKTCIESNEMIDFIRTQLNGIRQSQQLKQLLDELFNPKIIPIADLEEQYKGIIEEQRAHLSQCTKIAAYLIYRLLEEHISGIADAQSWLDQLTFLVDIYVHQVDNINGQLQQQTNRKKSLIQEITSFDDFTTELTNERCCPICSPKTANILVELIQRQFHRSPSYWILLIKVVQRLKPSLLVEQKIFFKMLTTYLQKLEDDLQQVLFVEMLNLTKALTSSADRNITELNSFILRVLLESPKTALVRGLLSQLIVNKSCRINLQVTGLLFNQTADYLEANCQLGGRDGAYGAPESLIVTLELGKLLTSILSSAEFSTETKALKQYLQTHQVADFRRSLSKIIRWAIQNPQTTMRGSPSQDLLQSLIDDISAVLKIVAQIPQAAKTFLQGVLDAHTEITNSVLLNQSLAIYQRYTLMKNTLGFMRDTIDHFLNDSQIVKEFTLDLGGFSFLLKCIGAVHTSDNLQDLAEKEVANKVTLINLPGQSINFTGQDWTLNKKGQKARIFNMQMNEEEYPLLIELSAPVELKTIRLGFQTFVADFNDKVFGTPSAILVEGGSDAKNLQPLGMMELINDEAFSNYAQKVFQINMLRGLKRVPGPILFLKFHIRKPVITFLEGISQLATRSYNNVNVAVSFLSIMANDYDKLATNVVNLPALIGTLLEDTAFKLIEKICSPRFDLIREFAKNEQFVQQIKESCNKLNDALPTNENAIAPLLIGLSKYNLDMGDWLLEQLYQFNRREVHAKLVGQIIMNDETRLIPRLQTLLKFILNNLVVEDIKNILYLTLLIDSFTIVLQVSAKNLQNQSLQQIQLDYSVANIALLVELFRKHHQLTQSKLFIKLLVNLVHPPSPYVPVDDVEQCVKLCHLNPIQEPHIFQVISPLLIGPEQYILQYVEDNLDAWFNSLFEILKDVVKTDTSVYHYFSAFVTMTHIPKLLDLIVSKDYHMTVYRLLRQEQPSNSLLKQFDPQAIPLIVKFIGNCSLHSDVRNLAERLRVDLQVLATTVDMSFVEKVLMPLLNYESKVEVPLNVWDSDSQKYVTDIKYLQHKVIQTQDEVTQPVSTHQYLPGFDSPSFTAEYKNQLNNTIGQLRTTPTKPNQKWKLVQEWTLDNDHGIAEKIRDSLTKAPFLLLFHGMNGYNESKATVGFYCTAPCQLIESETKNLVYNYEILGNQESFYFTYENKHLYHYPVAKNERVAKFVYEANQSSASLTLIQKSAESMFIGFPNNSNFFIEISTYDYKPLESSAPEDYYVQDFTLQNAELWLLETPQVENSNTSLCKFDNQAQLGLQNFGYGQLSTALLPSEYLSNDSVYSYYTFSPVYALPKSASVSDIQSLIYVAGFGLKDKCVVDLTEHPNSLEVNGLKLLQNLHARDQPVLKYDQQLKIFEAFQQLDGIKQIIETARQGINCWQNQERAKVWGRYIEELHAFSAVPAFFSFFLKNKPSMELLFELLAGLPDKNTEKKYEELESSSVKFIYDTLSEVFTTSNNEYIRVVAVEQQLISKILERIGLVSKEVKRQRIDQAEQSEDEQPQFQRKDSGEEPKKPVKKKGVGYGSDQHGQNQKWNTQEYINKSKNRSDQLKSLLQIVRSFFDFNWGQTQLGESLRNLVMESSLLPLLESAFRSGSLLEMSKDADLNLSFLSLTKVLAQHKVLTPLLMQIPENYVPRQIESIGQLLSQLKDVANIFLKTVTNESDSDSKNIAKAIIDVQHEVQQAIDTYSLNDQSQEDREANLEKYLAEVLQMPLPKSYPILLKDLRFDYVSMKVDNKYEHHYSSSVQPSAQPSSAKLVRLAQEFADMSNSLPIEHTNSIFVRADKDRVDVMKAMVMGAKGTPYAHGAYVFDIFFDDGYPQGPPKMNLSTTGSGKVRFNPNLYSCGKVCLSLLGTWRGNASENWDPKISTLLQILVSTQAIIMSEEVYFNEPGFEGEAGTEEGDKKNEAYSNIVRYCNIKYAMIDAIKEPPKGFEQVIKRHFYLKQDEILAECRKWIKYAETRQACYNGLVNDHNQNWSSEFKTKPNRYLEMLTEAVNELEGVLQSLKPPTVHDLKGAHFVIKAQPQRQQKKDIKEGMANIDEADVTYEREVQQKTLNVQDESVRDRWSRYIGAMGIEAVQRQANASVFVSGLGALGVEVVKNVVLSGVKSLTIHDSQKTTHTDLSGQFFLSESDIDKNRAEASLNKIQQLNYYVRVNTHSNLEVLPTESIETFLPNYKDYQLIVITQHVSNKVIKAWGEFCRSNKIKLIISSVDGVFGRIINDFGEEFIIEDKNGEEIPEVIVKQISTEGVVEILEGQRHLFEDNDLVLIQHVQGMETEDGKSINGEVFKVKTINKSSFSIGDVSKYSPHIRNGVVKHIKQPTTIKFQPLQTAIDAVQVPFDPTLQFSDYEKINNPIFTHLAYEAFQQSGDLQLFKEVALDLAKNKYEQKDNLESLEVFLQQFIHTVTHGSFAPLCAFLGGFVAQEAIKALTQKFTPIHQIFYTDCVEVLQDLSKIEAAPKEIGSNRSDIYRHLLGSDVQTQLENLKLFMVGCGAIGCELLKNFAMLNIGVNGAVTITDPDHIETSNLNRQFLFREKHIRKPKSQTAAAAVCQMNPLLKGRIIARLDKVFEGTESTFNDQFFESQNIVANALDNVQARRYVDRRCVTAKVPLLESGTLGPKGHVQCIIPFKTESYGSQNDPVEEGDIPYCTLKMFPEETFHCVEFARDKFGKLFTLLPKSAVKIISDVNFKPTTPEEVKALREVVKLLKNAPKTLNECIVWARRKFQKYFVNDINQLLFTYPLDHKTKDGKLFWTMPKRPPTRIEFDSANELHVAFVSTLAYLRANLFGLEVPKNWRDQEVRNQMATYAQGNVQLPEWVPSEQKKAEISSEVSKQQQQSTEEQEEVKPLNNNEKEELLQELATLRQKSYKLKPEEFEKDSDQNGHIDFIHSFGNLRASNYKLDSMDWLTVKIKAGRIVPALATTTAVIAGLQTIELIKIIKKQDLKFMKNAFINLAIPYVQLTEPGPAPTIKLNEKVSVNLWDRWEFKGADKKLSDLFSHFKEQYELHAVNVFARGAPVYMEQIHAKNESQKEQLLNSTLQELFGLDDYVDITVNFVRQEGDSELVQGVPVIRVHK